MNARLRLFLVTWTMVAAGGAPQSLCAAEEPAAAPPAAEVRRVFAPADALPQWPWTAHRYLPLPAAEFERLLKLSAAGDATAPDHARIIAADYTARYSEPAMLRGHATFKIVVTQDDPVAVLLGPTNLVLTEPAWADRDEPVVWGTTPSGRIAVLATGSGTLQCDWSLRGQADATGNLLVNLEVPPATSSRLRLELPAGFQVLGGDGAIARCNSPSGQSSPWEVLLGGRSQAKLTLVAQAPAADRDRPTVRLSSVYECLPRGLDLSVQCTLDVRGQPLETLGLVLDPGLRLVSARLGNRSLRWAVVSAPPGKPRRLELQFPEPLDGPGHSLRLATIAPLSTDASWTLPRLWIDSAAWEQGSITLQVPPPMSLLRVVPQGCRQSALAALPGQRQGDALQFECFAADAALAVQLARRQPQLQVQSGTAAELTSVGIEAEVIADLKVVDGELFALEAEVGRQWVVDTVETVPDAALDDWSLDSAEGRTTLKLALRHGITPSHPLRVKISARRLFSPLGRRLALDDVVPLRLGSEGHAQRWVTLSTTGPYELTYSDSEHAGRVAAGALDAQQRELFAELPRGLLLIDDARADALRIAMTPRKPAYTATVRVEAVVGRGGLQESYRIACVPDGGRVDRVLVHFSHRRGGPLRWTLGNDDQQALSARLLSAGEMRALGLSPEEEAWEVLLRRPRATSFELRATRTTPLAPLQAVSLAAVPEARSQQASVVVRMLAGRDAQIQNQRLRPITPDVESSAKGGLLRAAYAYNPARDVTATGEPALSIVLTDTGAPVLAWATRGELQSRYQSDGQAEHWALYQLQGSGYGRLRVTLPEGVDRPSLLGVWINRQPPAWSVVAEDGPLTLLIDLPLGDRAPLLGLRYLSATRRLPTLGTLRPPLPRLDVPVLDQHWTVWLPPGYVASGAGSPNQQTPLDAPATGMAWRARLFGPLARVGDGLQDSLATWEGWLPLNVSRGSAALTQRGDVLIETLTTLAESAGHRGQAGDALGWATLLENPAVEQVCSVVLIDEMALANEGVVAASPVVLPAGVAGPEALRLALQQAHLALVIHPAACLVTTPTGLALLNSQIERGPRDVLATALPGPLFDRIQEAAAGNDVPGIITLPTWAGREGRPAGWAACMPEADHPTEVAGWTAWRREVLSAAQTRLAIVYVPRQQLYAWSLFLLVAALGGWWARRHPASLVLLWGLAGVTALSVPASVAPLASSVFLALIVAFLLRLLTPRRIPPAVAPPADDRTAPATFSVRGGVVAGLLLAGWLTGMSPRTLMAAAAPPAEHPPWYDVFVPTDEKQRPTGGVYYVPEELYRQLQRTAQAQALPPWFLSNAMYRGALVWQATPERLVLGDLKARLEIQVQTAPALVRLPWNRDLLAAGGEALRLDGRALRPQGETSAGVLAVSIDTPGVHHLEAVLRMTAQGSGTSGSGEIPLPPVASARLELKLPPDAPPIEVAAAAGDVLQEDDPPRLTAELGAIDRLSISWPETLRRGRRPVVDAEQLLWLKVLPDSVALEARLKFRVLEGQLREIPVQIDPRWRLLPPAADDPLVVRVSPSGAGGGPMRFELARPITDKFVLDATFLWSGTSTLGQLRLPTIEVPGVRLARRVAAISLDASLAAEEPRPRGGQPLGVSEFVAEWGASAALPQTAYVLPADTSSWGISIRPRRSATTVEQVLAVSIDRGRAELYLDAQLSTTGGQVFQHRLLVPPGLEVERASLTTDSGDCLARWASSTDGKLALLLSRPVAGRQTLALRGRLSIPERGTLPLPIVGWEQAQVRSSSIELFRRANTTVKLGKVAGLTEQAFAGDRNRGDLGRLVRAWSVDPRQTPSVSLTVAPNQPVIEADQVLRLLLAETSATLQLDLQVTPRGGLVDRLQVEAPAPWTGPYRVDPPTAIRVVETPGESRYLVLEPAEPLEKPTHLTITGSLPFVAGSSLRVPDVRLRGGTTARRHLVLPRLRDRQNLTWDLQGLKQVEATAELTGGQPAVVYQVRSEPFRAVLQATQVAPKPQVVLADVDVLWKDEYSYRGRAVFDLDPGGAASCTLQLPADARLARIVVAGVGVYPEARGDNRWRVPLVLGQLPQPIEVLWVQPWTAADTNALDFTAPELLDVPVRQTLWRVAGPEQLRCIGSSTPPSASLLHGQTVRLKCLIAQLELDLHARSVETEELHTWYRLGSRRLAAARAALARDIAQIGSADGPETLAAAKAEVQAADRLAAQLQSWIAGHANGAAAETVVDSDPAGLRETATAAAVPVLHCGGANWIGRLTLQYAPAQTRRPFAAAWHISLLLMTMGCAWFALRRGWTAWIWRHCPWLVATAAGVVWWLWLTPPGWGAVLVVASLVLPLYRRWSSRPGAAVTVLKVHPSRVN